MWVGRLAVAAGVGLAIGTGSASAQTCAANSTVIARTIQVQTNVNRAIVEAETRINNIEYFNADSHRNRLLAAIKVLTQQVSASGSQTQTAYRSASQAQATTVVQQRHNLAVLDAKERYSSVGYNPCEFGQAAGSFYQAMQQAPQRQQSIRQASNIQPGQWGDPGAWVQRAKASAVYDANVLFSGDTSAASRYIDFVIGPPMERLTNVEGTANERLRELTRNNTDAYRSAAAEIMASIAADNAPGGPVERAREVAKFWIGDDGGLKWAATVAQQQDRGPLQDAVRIEAARLSTLALRIRAMKRTEFSIATYALARTNALVSGNASDSPGNKEGVFRRASLMETQP